MNSHEVFIHIHQGCFAGTGAIVRLPQCQWSKPDGYGEISQCITTTKHSKAKTVCIFLGIYCRCYWNVVLGNRRICNDRLHQHGITFWGFGMYFLWWIKGLSSSRYWSNKAVFYLSFEPPVSYQYEDIIQDIVLFVFIKLFIAAGAKSCRIKNLTPGYSSAILDNGVL